MNLEKLIKLAKLANNNPNDNEANLAARKVCKMIADNNYQFNNIQAPFKQDPRTGPITWDDVKRSTEPFWRSNPYSGSPFSTDFEELLRKVEEARRKTREEAAKQYQEAKRYHYNPNYTYYWDPVSERNKRKTAYEQKLRKCTVCNEEKMSGDGKEPYICGKCQWDKYYNEQNK